MKYLYLPEMLPTIRRISNSYKVVKCLHVVECEYELLHIPTFKPGFHLMQSKVHNRRSGAWSFSTLNAMGEWTPLLSLHFVWCAACISWSVIHWDGKR